jgi:hypothetical protein
MNKAVSNMLKPAGAPLATNVNCPRKDGGVLFDVSSLLAAALGVKQLKCDKCGSVMSVKPEVAA